MNIPTSLKIHHRISVIVRFILGAIFIAAGIPKIMNPTAFAGVIYSYQLLPDMFINIFAITLPWLEVITGGLLIMGLWMQGTVILYNLLIIVFVSALSFNIARGLDVSCGCFSTEPEKLIDMGTIFRDVILLSASLYLVFVVYIKKITGPDIFSRE